MIIGKTKLNSCWQPNCFNITRDKRSWAVRKKCTAAFASHCRDPFFSRRRRLMFLSMLEWITVTQHSPAFRSISSCCRRWWTPPSGCRGSTMSLRYSGESRGRIRAWHPHPVCHRGTFSSKPAKNLACA